ncbi:MAG: FTR1 family protein [Actinobacteria bacterium]|nr:FTR1 family protein [Actinomycetota bacterium]
MLPTFVIGLREGLEAALIVGIVAAFLRQRGRIDLLRWVWVGVAVAVALCFAIGVALDALSRDLPQRQQEGLETVIGAVAVGMVTYMVVWMKRHSRDLKGQLEGAAGSALLAGSGWALVAMAFLAVIREGFETVVFLLAAFNEAGGPSAGTGAVLGILLSVALGYGIYRGGVRINLSKFFRFTGVVLVLVAAGLVVTALHTAHEAGWLDVGQQRTVNLSGLIRPGSVQASLLTGMLGVQPRPVLIEVVGWLIYVVPVGLFVAWPPGRGLDRRVTGRLVAAGALVAALAGTLLLLLAPAAPRIAPRAVVDGQSVRVVDHGDPSVIVVQNGPSQTRVARGGSVALDGRTYTLYRETATSSADGVPLTFDQVAARNRGRLPLGVQAEQGVTVAVRNSTATTTTVTVDPITYRVVDLQVMTKVTTIASLSVGATPLADATAKSAGFTDAQQQAAVAAAERDAGAADDRAGLRAWGVSVLLIAGLCGVISTVALFGGRRRPSAPVGKESTATTQPVPAVTQLRQPV